MWQIIVSISYCYLIYDDMIYMTHSFSKEILFSEPFIERPSHRVTSVFKWSLEKLLYSLTYILTMLTQKTSYFFFPCRRLYTSIKPKLACNCRSVLYLAPVMIFLFFIICFLGLTVYAYYFLKGCDPLRDGSLDDANQVCSTSIAQGRMLDNG